MAGTRIYPHRQIDVEAVTWHDWWIERSGTREVLQPVLTAWDYASEIAVGTTLEFDPKAVLESTGVSRLEDLEVLVLGDCLETQQRLIARRTLDQYLHGTPMDIALTLPPGKLASRVRLSAHVVLARTIPQQGFGVAHLRGSRLYSSDPYVVTLEGDAGRFPTEPVAFSEIYLGNAPWTVLALFEDLTVSFMGSVRLLINTEHPVGRLLLATPPDARFERLIKADIVRLLVARAAQAVDAGHWQTYDEGSVGQVLDAMCRIFLGMSLGTSARLYVDDPAAFDLMLHSRLDPLSGFAS